MNYVNIDLRSDLYQKMSKIEKLRVVRSKLNSLFLYDGKGTATVVYHDMKRKIDRNMVKVYKNLLEREKALEKSVRRRRLYTVDHTSVFFNSMSIDEKIDVMEDKLWYFFEINLHTDKYIKDKRVSINYKNYTMSVPITFYRHTITVIKMLEGLKKQKKEMKRQRELNDKYILIEKNVAASVNRYIDVNNNSSSFKKDKILPILTNCFEFLKDCCKMGVGLAFAGCMYVYGKFKSIKFKRKNNKSVFNSTKDTKSNKRKKFSFKKISILPIFVSCANFFKKMWKKTTGFCSVTYKYIKDKCIHVVDSIKNRKNSNSRKKFSFKKISILPIFVSCTNFFKEIWKKTTGFCSVTYKHIKDKCIHIVDSIKNRYKNSGGRKRIIDNGFKKKVGIVLCTAAILVTGMFSLSRNNKKINLDNVGTKPTTSQTDPVIDNKGENQQTEPTLDATEETVPKEDIEDSTIVIPDDKEEDNDKNNDTIIDNENKDDLVSDNDITFDDIITINDNSYIYTNSYDATYENNARNPYYGGTYERDVQGIVYELNGNIYIVYETDINALEKQQKLVSEGAVVTAVLVTRCDLVETNQYEGYYNVNSVKIKTR